MNRIAGLFYTAKKYMKECCRMRELMHDDKKKYFFLFSLLHV